MAEHVSDRLSDYLDGELEDHDAGAVEAHLRSCGECARTLDDLRSIKTWARTSRATPATSDPWFRVRSRIRLRRWRWPVLAAAAAAVILVSVPLREVTQPSAPADASTDSAELQITDLEQLLSENQERLDPRTAATLQASLREIDRALLEAQRALERDPASALLRQQIASARAQRERFLSTAVTLVRTEL